MNQANLVREIASRFNLSDLHTICFNLGFSYEEITGHNNLTDMARELVLWASKRRYMPELMASLAVHNPAFQWDGHDFSIVDPPEPPETKPIVDPERAAVLQMLETQRNMDSIIAALRYLVSRT